MHFYRFAAPRRQRRMKVKFPRRVKKCLKKQGLSLGKSKKEIKEGIKGFLEIIKRRYQEPSPKSLASWVAIANDPHRKEIAPYQRWLIKLFNNRNRFL